MDTLFSYFSHDKPDIAPKQIEKTENNNEINEQLAKSDSVILETERWSPYQNFLVFSSTVLLWQRPVIFVLLTIFTHLFLWYTTAAILKWNFWLVIGTIISTVFITDYMCSLFNITITRFLTFFPYDGTERISYAEIIQQYVTVRRFIRAQFHRALQFRKEQNQQFLISALFFTIVSCFLLSLVNVFTLVYLLAFVCLLSPGLWHNNVPHRVYVFAGPHVSSLYNLINQKMTEVLAPNPNVNANPSAPRQLNKEERKPKPNQNIPNLATTVVVSYKQQQRTSMENTNTAPYMPATAPTQQFFTQPPTQTIPPPNYYNSSYNQPTKRRQ